MIWTICNGIVYLFEAIIFAVMLLSMVNLMIPVEEQPEMLATVSRIIFEPDGDDLYETE